MFSNVRFTFIPCLSDKMIQFYLLKQSEPGLQTCEKIQYRLFLSFQEILLHLQQNKPDLSHILKCSSIQLNFQEFGTDEPKYLPLQKKKYYTKLTMLAFCIALTLKFRLIWLSVTSTKIQSNKISTLPTVCITGKFDGLESPIKFFKPIIEKCLCLDMVRHDLDEMAPPRNSIYSLDVACVLYPLSENL